MEKQILENDIRYLKGVGEKKAACYNKLNIKTVADLIRFYPRTYLDFTSPIDIAQTEINEVNIVKATVFKKQPEQRIRKGMSIYKVFVTDHSSNMCITIFNNKFLYDKLSLHSEYYFYGKVTGSILRKEMNSPTVIPANTTDLIRPIYHQTEGLNSNAISTNIKSILPLVTSNVYDPIPSEILQKFNLCHLSFALDNIHFPQSTTALNEARRRLIFEELLTLQIGLLQLKSRNRKLTPIHFEDTSLDDFYSLLPFTLTNAQQRAISEAIQDFKGLTPMNRLVQGDVGSGKTMVAAALCFLAHKNGYQSAIMAPTEILAKQHYNTFFSLFDKLEIKTCLLTGSDTPKQKKLQKEQIANGEYSIIIGTHTLVQQSVSFSKLGLVVTDEQHRFGVSQRSSLADKGDNPHILVMSATPIPRTLALIIYGDLDISVIDELPAGRQKTQTLIINSSKRERALSFIKEQIVNGKQAYIVCPLVEETESELADVTSYYNNLIRGTFKDIPTGLLHGKLPNAQKENIMTAFKNNEISVLVSTTVIEVGVDVPNATVMMIENAERYGLSQLHQLRGRVGRGSDSAYCILLSDNRSETTNARLKTMASTTDGFVIAQEDLKLRGPGDFFGERQHGLPKLKIADMSEDITVLKQTQEIAKEIVADDPTLEKVENKGLKQLVLTLFSNNSDSAYN